MGKTPFKLYTGRERLPLTCVHWVGKTPFNLCSQGGKDSLSPVHGELPLTCVHGVAKTSFYLYTRVGWERLLLTCIHGAGVGKTRFNL
jgi:hypothetical protein